ncbi:hypothetical protein DF16_pBMB69orf00004 (plasmid) [Bacillus thuringiensis serovar kurstaki str. YBT-1520]|nr:hypothetical protein DF16_pBMB69orf00004 [Bacillus thuringiensis serovar kurstaki str. YBT-1520]
MYMLKQAKMYMFILTFTYWVSILARIRETVGRMTKGV